VTPGCSASRAIAERTDRPARHGLGMVGGHRRWSMDSPPASEPRRRARILIGKGEANCAKLQHPILCRGACQQIRVERILTILKHTLGMASMFRSIRSFTGQMLIRLREAIDHFSSSPSINLVAKNPLLIRVSALNANLRGPSGNTANNQRHDDHKDCSRTQRLPPGQTLPVKIGM
jgi:hypothetical protein